MPSLRSGLGPHCVGQRVVVRRVLPGQTGPTGGPAMTDVLGVMESWTAERTTVRAAGGEVVEIALADIVSGKPVPPRPSARQRVPVEEAERRAEAAWPASRADEGTVFLLAPVAQAVRAARRLTVAGHPELRLEEVSEAGREVATVTVPEVARGRAAVPDAGADAWAGLADLWVHPDQRRQGLGTAVLGELLGWAAERGATTAFARAPADDAAALACLERLGFAEHHR